MSNRNDVAKRAGVSSATVSRVMNQYPHISDKVRQRVLKAAEELGYLPHLGARNLKMRKSDLIACLIPDITNPYYTEIFKGINKRGKQLGYQVFLEETGNSFSDALSLLERRVGGVIACTSIPKDEMERLLEKVPVVSLARSKPEHVPYYIGEDLFAATELAVNHLFEAGHRSIALIIHETDSEDILQGFKAAHRRLGIDCRPELIVTYSKDQYHYQYNSGYLGMKTLLEKNCNASAIIANNDLIAIGAMAAADAAGYQIPQQLSFVGIDNTAIAGFSRPSLTSIQLLKFKKGILGVEMLVNLMNGVPVQPVPTTAKLIVRQSVAVRTDVPVIGH